MGSSQEKFRASLQPKNSGYITCSELWEVFNKDVWVHEEQLRKCNTDQWATFHVVINTCGFPQAVFFMPCTEFNHTLFFSV